ncbi:hypothetical protein IHE44_0005994 [Lamprotornis superbus]|uniref:FCSD2 protein n=1 Tax=Lamprotornis superbus TaxID=245042 RepID=A0A835NH91_9PASS|nr:hypothetical protein IHE44_0005994 [Lamprotornis superbus]
MCVVKVTQELKNIQVEQMTKLQAKHQAECDLLEDISWSLRSASPAPSELLTQVISYLTQARRSEGMFLSPETERGRVVIPDFLGRLGLVTGVSCSQGLLLLRGSAGLQECGSITALFVPQLGVVFQTPGPGELEQCTETVQQKLLLKAFSQKRAAIEKEYAQSIQKLASQYLKKDWLGIRAEERSDYRSMYSVWKSLLEGTMQVAQSRLNICENYKNLISEPARSVRCFKEQQLKKCVDQLTRIQAELQETVKDLAKGKKKYFETEQMAQAVREKADIEAKSKLSLFQSRISLQKASVKLKARRSECNSKAIHARNDYLLTLAAANAHQDRYYQTDLVNIMKIAKEIMDCKAGPEARSGEDEEEEWECSSRRLQRPNNKGFVSKNNDPGEIVKEQNDVQNNHQTAAGHELMRSAAWMIIGGNKHALDGNIYDHLKDYLMAFSRTELETCQAVQNTFQFLLETSSRVVRDYNLQLFLQENSVFHKPQPFQFQPSDSDTSRQLESETGTTEEHSLNKEARKWATRVAREHKNIIHSQRTLEELECHGPVMSEQTRAELEQKIDEARESIRKAEGVLGTEVLISLPSSLETLNPGKSKPWEELRSSHGFNNYRDVQTGTEMRSGTHFHREQLWEPPGWFLDQKKRRGKIIKLKAEARLELLKQIGVSVDTWLKSAMNQVMEELENERWASLPSVTNNGSAHLASQPDELTIEEHEVLEVIEDGDMEDWVKARNKAGQVGYVPEKYLQFPTSSSLLSMLQSLAALDTRSHTSNNSTEADLVPGSLNGDSNVCFVKALYDYDGQTDDELSFPEGAIIRILNKENQDDDGFWEGEFNGRVGVFPSVLVEELTASENGETPWIGDIQVSPTPKSNNSLPPLPLYDQPPSSPYPSPDKRGSQFFPRSPSTNENSFGSESPGFSQPPRIPPESSYGKLRPVRAAPPPPTQHHRRPTEKMEDVEITLVAFTRRESNMEVLNQQQHLLPQQKPTGRKAKKRVSFSTATPWENSLALQCL